MAEEGTVPEGYWKLYDAWANKLSLGIGLPHRGSGGRTGTRILKEQFMGLTEWIDKGYWAITISSNVNAIRYNKQAGILWVAFTSKSLHPSRLYKYHKVEIPTAEACFDSVSLGRFVHNVLKRGYPTEGPLRI